jgi:hypothetical protein
MKTLITTIVLLIILLSGIWIWYGGFYKVSPTIRQIQKTCIVIERRDGIEDQLKSGDGNLSNDLLKSLGENEALFAEIYFFRKNDNSRYLEHYAGLIFESDKIHNTDIVDIKYNTIKISSGKTLYVSFPYKGKLSKAFGIMRVYPALKMFCAKNGISSNYPILEVVNLPEKRIEFSMLLESIDETKKES